MPKIAVAICPTTVKKMKYNNGKMKITVANDL
jgi:hypothetical protein